MEGGGKLMVKRDPNEDKEDIISTEAALKQQDEYIKKQKAAEEEYRKKIDNEINLPKVVKVKSITKEEIEKMIQEALDKFKPQEITIPDQVRSELVYLFTGRYHQMRTKSPFAIHELDKLAEFFKIPESEYKIEKPKKK